MAVINVTSTDEGQPGQRWAVPTDNRLNDSPIPRGIRHYAGSVAIAALGAGDVTNVGITFAFPEQSVWLCKSLSFLFSSDDATEEFNPVGMLEYQPEGVASISRRRAYTLLSEGAVLRIGLRAQRVWRPLGTWRQFVNGPDGDTILHTISDPSSDASTAGDVGWVAEFWEYDIEQCFKWPLNTPQPTIAY